MKKKSEKRKSESPSCTEGEIKTYDMFFRGDHPDKRSDEEFIHDLNVKLNIIKTVKKETPVAYSFQWYPRRKIGRIGYGVKCINNGDTYKSIKDASIALKIDNTNLGRHLRGDKRHSHVKGYKFEFIDR